MSHIILSGSYSQLNRIYDNTEFSPPLWQQKGILLRGPVQERPATEWHLLLANHRHQVLVPQGLLRHGNCRGRLDRKLIRKLKSCIFLKVIALHVKISSEFWNSYNRLFKDETITAFLVRVSTGTGMTTSTGLVGLTRKCGWVTKIFTFWQGL